MAVIGVPDVLARMDGLWVLLVGRGWHDKIKRAREGKAVKIHRGVQTSTCTPSSVTLKFRRSLSVAKLRQLLVMYRSALFVINSQPDMSRATIFFRLWESKKASRLRSERLLHPPTSRDVRFGSAPRRDMERSVPCGVWGKESVRERGVARKRGGCSSPPMFTHPRKLTDRSFGLLVSSQDVLSSVTPPHPPNATSSKCAQPMLRLYLE